MRPPVDPAELNLRLAEYKIFGGLPLGAWNPELADALLVCVTEARTRSEIDRFVDAVREITAG